MDQFWSLEINNLNHKIMKPIIKWLIIALIVVTIFSLPSCSKDNGLGGTVGVDIGGVQIVLSWGNTNTTGYYYGNLPQYSNVFVGYIAARPMDPNNIPICTSGGVAFCTASCTSFQWQEANYFFTVAQSVTYPPIRPVLVKRVRNTITTAGDEFYIIGY